ncbi:Serine/threonine-protein kinase 32A [Triplophysa tibetana]|uniref:non-specific serine/threonine protein kinase n=1 Tax=Triplophysa tibetana TaxID=1572043 RepID=A0A5A9PLD8_9TELE|nr:Serine/threonine-protein kinase 32A [Triplophysa tibetana]
MSPMEWKPRTSKKPGRYQKVILEEAPPRILVAGTEDYHELIRIAQDAFWTEKEREGSTFTLCHSDGTRWTKEQFCEVYGSVRFQLPGREHFILDVEKGLEGNDSHFVALDISMAVEYIHSKNVIHQDLKPDNILIDQVSKKAVLTDWGLANIRGTVLLRQGSRFTGGKIGPMGGTFLYMAPECLIEFEEASRSSDIWSLGVTYLELFTKLKPWTVKKQKQLCSLLTKNAQPHALEHLCERYSFISMMVHYDPASRPEASSVVLSLKTVEGLDLQSRYGYKW